MLPRMVGALNRMLGVADARLVRKSRLAHLEAELTAQRGRIAELETSLRTLSEQAPNWQPSEEWRRNLLMDIAGIMECKLNDASLIGYNEASRTTAAYIVERMQAARI